MRRLAVLGWLAHALAGCGDADGEVEVEVGADAPAPLESGTSTDLPPEVTEPAASSVTVLDSCAAIDRSAETDPHDAYALAMLCPDIELSPTRQRAALMVAGTPTQIEQVLPRLTPDSELAALARLLARHAPDTLPARVPDVRKASVTPVDDEIVGNAALAHATYISAVAHPDDRTRAQAYLAKVHLYALQSLGLDGTRPLDPFARLLAGRAVAHGRGFCVAYWQRRVAGLDQAFADTEARLVDAVIALEASPHGADPALVAVERQRGRRYVQGASERIVKSRAKKGLDPTAGERILPFPHEVDRLLDQGFVDLAITRSIVLGRDAQGYGLGRANELVSAAMAERGLNEYEAKLQARLEAARAAQPPPHEQGPREIEDRRAMQYATPDSNALRARAWLEAAPAEGLGRRHALTRATLLLRDDPRALDLLLAEAETNTTVRAHAGLLFELAGAADRDALVHATGLAARDLRPETGDPHEREARRRRELALAVRTAGLSPR